MRIETPLTARQLNRRDFLRQSTLAGLGVAAGGLGRISWSLENDQLHIRNYADVTYLDPALSISGAEGLIGNAIFQNLLQFKTEGSWDARLRLRPWVETVSNRAAPWGREPP